MRNILVKNRGLISKIIQVAFLILLSLNCFALNIIRDSEIEKILNLIADPVIRAAGLKPNQINIYIVNDDTINAFTPGGKEIYINSGLIKNFDNPDIIRGVIAHELGHIVGGHRPTQALNSEQFSNTAMSAMGLGLAVAGVFKDFSPGFAIALGGVHYSERSMLYYSRIDEAIADKSALRFLEMSGHSSIGLIKLMETLYTEHRGIAKYVSPYDLSHPLSEVRLNSIKRFHNTSKHKNSNNGDFLTNSYKRAYVKLKAFTDNPDTILKNYNNLSDLSIYAKAIAYFRKSQKSEAINYINMLLTKYPNDPYYNELKGQILFEFGKGEALKYYDIALAKLPQDTMLLLSNSIVRLNVHSNNISKLKPIEANLKIVLTKEPNNITALYYQGIYYEKIGKKNKSLLSMALFFFKKGEIKKAKSYASQVIASLKRGSSEWYKANDIINTDI